MADPLKLLREYSLDRKPVKEKDDFIVFGDIAFPKDVKTNFRVYGKQNEYYTLESLYFFFQKRELVHTVYVKEAAGKQLQPVTRPDRKDLIEYLTTHHAKQPSSIDITAPIPPPVLLARQTSHHTTSTQEQEHVVHSEAKKPRTELSDAERQKEKERMERILDGGLRHPGKDVGIRDLSEKLTADKIAALKSKVITRKRTLIKSTEDTIVGGSPGQTAGLVGLSAAELDALDRDLKARERLWRTRTSCMETSVKNFAKSVFPILQSLKAREESSSGPKPVPPPAELVKKEDPVNKSRAVQQPGYSRYDQERFRKEETEGFQIDTMGTYHGITLKSITEGAKPKPQMNPSVSGSQENEPSRPHKRVSRTPIIVIPAANTSLITMYNARDLFQDYRYVSPEEKKNQGFRRENELLIQRQKDGGVTVPYRVVDNALKLTAEEWDRVVAVFVQGPAWQFKGWPWGGVPVEIFSKIAAFHLKWDEMKLDPNVAKWNVTVLALSKNKRHLDRANLLRFWELLEKYRDFTLSITTNWGFPDPYSIQYENFRYMLKNKPHLRF